MTNQPPPSHEHLDSASLARVTQHAQTVAARRVYRLQNPWPAEGVAVHPSVVAAAASQSRTLAPLSWPHGVRWEHLSASMYPVWNAAMLRHVQWMKACGVVGLVILTDGNAGQGENDGDSGYGFVKALIEQGEWDPRGIVIRFYRAVEHGWTDAMSKAVDKYLQLGVDKFQTTNEPDLWGVEWSHKPDPTRWLEISWGEYWHRDAHMINSRGGWAGTPPMASGVFRQRNDAGFWGPDLNPFAWSFAQSIKLFCILHPYLLNHPWDYPYDAVNRDGAPLTQAEYDWATGNGRWNAWDGQTLAQINAIRARDKNPGATIYTDDACGMVFTVYEDKMKAAGYVDGDLVGGEGWPVNMDRQDPRYPRNTPPVMEYQSVKHFAWLGQHANYRGTAAWIFESGSGGWQTCQHHQPGAPEANSEGYLIAVDALRKYPKENDFASEPPPEPPTPPQPPDNGGGTTEDPNVNKAISYGASVKRALVNVGAWYWKATLVEHLTPEQNRGNHNVFADVLDEHGNRARGVAVRVENINGVSALMPLDKPANEPMGNVPLNKNDTLALSVVDDEPSDRVEGLHSRHPDEAPGNTLYHHSFHVVFQRAQKTDENGDGSGGGGGEPTKPMTRFDFSATVTVELSDDAQSVKRIAITPKA